MNIKDFIKEESSVVKVLVTYELSDILDPFAPVDYSKCMKCKAEPPAPGSYICTSCRHKAKTEMQMKKLYWGEY